MEFEGRRRVFREGNETANALKKLAAEEKATLYMVLLSAYNILLAKLGSGEDIIVGTPVEGRGHEDLRGVTGMFVNTLALRNYPEGRKPFNRFLAEVRERTIAAFDNQDTHFEELVDKLELNRDIGRNPLFDVMFIMENPDMPEVEIPGLRLEPIVYETGKAKFDLTLQGNETPLGIRFELEYRKKLYKSETVQRIAGYFKNIVAAVIKSPVVKIEEIEIIPAEEKREIVTNFNNTGRETPRAKTIQGLFEEQEQRRPDATAVKWAAAVESGETGGQTYSEPGTRKLTYRELNHRAQQQARYIQKKGAGPGHIVAIMADRSVAMVVAVLAVLKAGSAYLPITPDYPQERINYILVDSNAKILLKEKDTPFKTTQVETLNLEAGTGQEAQQGEPPAVNITATPTTKPATKPTAAQPAYIIYTSGTTGKPKGVMVEHGSAVNTLEALQQRYPLLETDTYLLKTSFIFDVSVSEIFGWYQGGVMLAILEKGAEKDPQAILN
ncbi:MAG: AMP-binding protein, partial [bacterium]|nr:AMP-binding protein [bacterium]